MLAIFNEFDFLAYNPKNKRYKLVPSKEWMIKHTPPLPTWKEDEYDCDAIAADTYSLNHGYCLGMITVKWKENINHTLNVVFFESGEVLLYDALTEKFMPVSKQATEDFWI